MQYFPNVASGLPPEHKRVQDKLKKYRGDEEMLRDRRTKLRQETAEAPTVTAGENCNGQVHAAMQSA
jgi:hypothetical protein